MGALATIESGDNLPDEEVAIELIVSFDDTWVYNWVSCKAEQQPQEVWAGTPSSHPSHVAGPLLYFGWVLHHVYTLYQPKDREWLDMKFRDVGTGGRG